MQEFLQKKAGPRHLLANAQASQVLAHTGTVVNVMAQQKQVNVVRDVEENVTSVTTHTNPPPTKANQNVCSILSKFFYYSFLASFTFVRLVIWLITLLLMVGTLIQANLYNKYPPQGTYVTIKYSNGYKQKILTQCVGTRNPSLPTLWVEVGGGGHSMR